MAKPKVSSAGGVRMVQDGEMKSSFSSTKMKRSKQGNGMSDKNATQLGYGKSALQDFKPNPMRKM